MNKKELKEEIEKILKTAGTGVLGCSCDGCSESREDAINQLSSLLDQTISKAKKEVIEEMSEVIEDGIRCELSIETIYANLQGYVLKALRGKK